MRLLLHILILLPCPLFGQSFSYELDIDDPSTYSITCGSLSGNRWEVINQTCTLTTSYMEIPDSCGPASITFAVSVQASGNMETDDYLHIQYFCDSSWVTAFFLTGPELSVTNTYSLTPTCGAGTFAVRLIGSNDDNSEKIRIDDGQLTFGYDCAVILSQPIEVNHWADHAGNHLTFLLNESTEPVQVNLQRKTPDEGGFSTIYSENITPAPYYYFSFTDRAPPCEVCYYRLVVVGEKTVFHSPAITIRTAGSDEEPVKIMLNLDGLALYFRNDIPHLNFHILDIHGRSVRSWKRENIIAHDRLLIETSFLPPGYYILLLSNDTLHLSSPFISGQHSP